MMGFLVPLYLAGLAALSLPVILHLVRRTPRGRQDFSSLMFLAPTLPKLTRRSRLDQLLLLAMRLSALALLAMAFSRPFLREAASFSQADLPGRRVALLVDTSASMRRADLWQQAVQLAERELGELGPQDDVALYTFGERLQTVIGFEQEGTETTQAKPQVIRQQLAALQLGWGSTDLGTALVAVAGEIDSTSDVRQSSLEPQIVVISDFQKGARIEALQAFEWPKRVPVVARQVQPAKRTNAFCHILPDDEERDGAEVRVRVVNAADSAGEQFYLAWSGDPAKVLRRDEVAVYVPAGQSRVVRLARGADALDADRIVLRGDDHPFDNTFFAVPPRKEKSTVLYAGSDGPDDADGMHYYLRLAVGNDPLRQVEVRALRETGELAQPDGSGPRLVVVTRLPGGDWPAALQGFAERGGLVLVVPADREAAAIVPALFDDVELPAESRRSEGDYALLGEIDFTHPLFAPFAGPRYGDFTKIHFWKHERLVLRDSPVTRAVARFDNADPALLERKLGTGRVLALMSGWSPDDSQLALSSKFVPLIGALLDLAHGTGQIATGGTVFEPVTLPELPGGPAFVVLAPGGRKIDVPAGSRKFTETVEPGIYRATAGTAEITFAVNLAATESNTAPLELEQLAQRGVLLGKSLTRVERGERIRQQRDTELEGRQKVWRWLIVAALGLLIAETWWAGRTERTIVRSSLSAA
jgi:Aerotolerance regulator N-terminal/von Willebrand factor type A domain